MASKSSSAAPADAKQVFRQFAWNLAGSLAGKKAQKQPVSRSRAAAARKRGAGK